LKMLDVPTVVKYRFQKRVSSKPMHPKLVQLETSFQASVLTRIHDPLLDEYQVELWLKRDDRLHPVISGNKWRKLKYCLDDALSLNAHTLMSMGGAYSNHLHALAYVGRALGLKTIGVIRGEPPPVFSATLNDLQRWGMDLQFVSRSAYRNYRKIKNGVDLPGLQEGQYWLPEGGAHAFALKGVAELVNEIDIAYDTICLPCGTGTTLAGLINAVSEPVSILGFSALKPSYGLRADIESWLKHPLPDWRLIQDYHFGGFAKTNAALMAFIDSFECHQAITLEPIYTGKMMYGLYDLITKRYFKPGHRIIALHTGGLQGLRGFWQRHVLPAGEL